MFCPKCGARNEDDARFCSKCANPLTPDAPPTPPAAEGGAAAAPEGGLGALGILFFCIPLAGAVMYFVWKDDKPAKAKQACTLALWGLGVGIVLQILATLLRQ